MLSPVRPEARELVTHETPYFADPFPAPAARATLAEPIPAASKP
jgi:hypothetical protein